MPRLFPLAVLAVLAAVALARPGQPEPAPADKRPAPPVPFGERNLAALPPEVADATVQLVRKPTTPGRNAVLRVRFAANEGLPDQLVIFPGDQRVVLRDDGRDGDAKAGDGWYTAAVRLDVDELARAQARADALVKEKPGPRPVFQNRTRVGVVKEPHLLDLKKLRDFELIRLPFPFPFGVPTPVDPARSLMVTHLKVVEDPARTFNPCEADPAKAGTPMGKWTFGHLMTQMANQPATGVSPSDFVRRWLRRWEFDQTINDWSVARRNQIRTQIIDPWEQKSGGPGAPLDLSKAPFKLLAIVNRIDLHENLVYGGGSAGEGRFVFCAVDQNCNPLQFTVIFEYGVKKSGCHGLRSWANQWLNLSTLPLGSPPYNHALEAITDQFTAAGADPAKPNGSALNQLRTNEIALARPWELREFQIFATDSDAHHLREVTVKQTPDDTVNRTTRLSDYVNANAGDVVLQRHTVPLDFPAGNHFLGGSSLVPSPGLFWTEPSGGPAIANREARHQFSLGTCSGCHAGETQTRFVHIEPAPFGTEAKLSRFLTGKNGAVPFTVPDPADGMPVRPFADLDRRAAKLSDLATMPCFFHLFHRPLRMTH